MKRPALPAAFYRPTVVGFVCYLLHAVSWILLFGTLAWQVYTSALPIWSKAILLPVCWALAGHSFHMAGWFSHEGVHLALLRNKYGNMLVACLMGGVTMHPALGYAVTHWTHHRYTNQKSDPDTKIYPLHTTFWARFLRGRVTASRGYMRNTVAAALNRPLPKSYSIPFAPGWTRVFALATLLSIAFWLSLYAAIGLANPELFVVCILCPFLCAIPATGLRIYMEHNGTGAGIFSDSRSYVSPLWTVIMFGNNYHLEHHLYPTVPAYNLPRVHRLLCTEGVFARNKAHIEHGFFAPLRYLSGSYQYPTPLIGDLTADPFAVSVVGHPNAVPQV
jgi:fatty acid desaturase